VKSGIVFSEVINYNQLHVLRKHLGMLVAIQKMPMRRVETLNFRANPRKMKTTFPEIPWSHVGDGPQMMVSCTKVSCGKSMPDALSHL
jgi:hypothetical protein